MFCFCGRLEIWGPPSNGRISRSNGRGIDYMIWPSWTWPIRQWRKGVCGITMKRPGRQFQKWGQFETSQTDVMQTQIGGPHIGSPRSRATKRNSLDHSKFGTRHLETPYNLRPAYWGPTSLDNIERIRQSTHLLGRTDRGPTDFEHEDWRPSDMGSIK